MWFSSWLTEYCVTHQMSARLKLTFTLHVTYEHHNIYLVTSSFLIFKIFTYTESVGIYMNSRNNYSSIYLNIYFLLHNINYFSLQLWRPFPSFPLQILHPLSHRSRQPDSSSPFLQNLQPSCKREIKTCSVVLSC